MHSDKGRRTQRHGCQGNIAIEGKRQMCAYRPARSHTHSFFVNDCFALLEDIQSVKTLGSITALSLEEMGRATCEATDTAVEQTWGWKT